MKKIIFLLVSVICFSCSKDPAVVPDYMDPQRFPLEIQPILKTFLKEGNKRGVYCDINKISKIVLTTNLSANNDGADGYFDHSSNTIFIDTTSWSWKTTPEALLFHELGHGLLKREHKNGEFSDYDSDPLSIMNGDEIGLPNYLYSQSWKRNYYIDELFNPSIPPPAPAWN
jgi:hypothetical protein